MLMYKKEVKEAPVEKFDDIIVTHRYVSAKNRHDNDKPMI
jgi:hypothetical protein